MSIKGYLGRMGSGKTYEVVSQVILPAIARGRRVVTNIAGLDYDAIATLLIEEGAQPDKLGQLVQVQHDEVLNPTFWRTDKDEQQGVNAVIQAGDLLALDEIWRFWEGFSNRSMPDRVMNFFRMHRHFTHPETGVSCDVAIITQDIGDIARRVRAVIEECYYMTKHTAVGSAKRYRVDIHAGGKITRTPLRQLQRTYDAKYFPLYSSHSQRKEGDARAVEENIDDRGNILKGALFRFVLPAMLVVFLVSGYFVFKFFNPQAQEQGEPVQVEAMQEQQPQPAQQTQAPQVVEDWRVVGYYSTDSGMLFVIQRPSGELRRLFNPPAFKITAGTVEVLLPEGGFATSWASSSKKGGVL